MLTNREKKWLKKRERYPFYGCQYCEFDKFGRHCMSEGIKANNGKMRCLIVPKKDAFKEAAEFEARVSAKLANYIETLGWKGCGEHALEHARLEVEEEMNA